MTSTCWLLVTPRRSSWKGPEVPLARNSMTLCVEEVSLAKPSSARLPNCQWPLPPFSARAYWVSWRAGLSLTQYAPEVAVQNVVGTVLHHDVQLAGRLRIE